MISLIVKNSNHARSGLRKRFSFWRRDVGPFHWVVRRERRVNGRSELIESPAFSEMGPLIWRHLIHIAQATKKENAAYVHGICDAVDSMRYNSIASSQAILSNREKK